MASRVVIHREQLPPWPTIPGHPRARFRWFETPSGEKLWLLDGAPGDGWTVFDENGTVEDGFRTLADVRRWAAQ